MHSLGEGQPVLLTGLQLVELPPPHSPLVQLDVQHCEVEVHERPSTLQVAPPQMPPLQVEVQHCEELVQLEPFAPQVAPPQMPPLQVEVQH
jgi:hypothetical protein